MPFMFSMILKNDSVKGACPFFLNSDVNTVNNSKPRLPAAL
jgi:hypothetical protein